LRHKPADPDLQVISILDSLTELWLLFCGQRHDFIKKLKRIDFMRSLEGYGIKRIRVISDPVF